MNKILTIIIPIYNAQEYISRCLESILVQVDEKYEILLINDGSRDNSEKIIKEYEKKYPNIIQVISKKNEGVSKTRNLGIKQAKGKFVCFIDNDDFVDEGYFQNFLNVMDDQTEIAIGGYKRVEETKIRFQVYPQDYPWYKFVVVAPWAKMYKKDFLLKNNIEFLEYGLGEDVYFSLVAYSLANNIKIVNEVGYNWYFNKESVSNTSQQGFNMQLDPLYLLGKIFERVGKREKEYDFFYVRYGIWYLLFSGKKAEKNVFLREYGRIFKWYEKHEISEKFPIFGKSTKGEKIQVKIIINLFLIMHKLKLIKLFAGIYCNGEK